MICSIDRFEEEYAVLCDEEENTRTVLRATLPQQAAVGDVLRQMPDGWVIDHAETEARRARVRALQQRLRRS